MAQMKNIVQIHLQCLLIRSVHCWFGSIKCLANNRKKYELPPASPCEETVYASILA